MKLKRFRREVECDCDEDGDRIGKGAYYNYDYEVLPHSVVTIHFTFRRFPDGTMDPVAEIGIDLPNFCDRIWEFTAYVPFKDFHPDRDILLSFCDEKRTMLLSEFVERLEKAYLAFYGSFEEEFV